VACPKPTQALITDFTPPEAGLSDAGDITFGDFGTQFSGGTFIYPTPALASDMIDGNWHISGQVGTYSGGGLWFSCNTGTSSNPTYVTCTIDASAYTGISFTVSGTGGPISVLVTDPATTKPTTDSAGGSNNCGTCTATNCGTSVSVPVSATATTVNFTWAQLGVTNPAAITSIAFSLQDPYSYASTPPVATPYSADISIDDLRFTS